MTWPVDLKYLSARLDYRNDRIGDADAKRQFLSVAEILCRLEKQPGIILADEVGMGKTFVALGVAAIAALADRGRRPVVIMVPPSLHEKWPHDFSIFRDRVLQIDNDRKLNIKSADNALEFFKLLDDETKIRPHIIFLKHGAFQARSVDHWVKFALIKRALHGMRLGERRDALPRFADRILRVRSIYRDPALFAMLLNTPNQDWKRIVNTYYETSPERQLSDDPVPEAVQKVLESSEINLEPLKECLRRLPARETGTVEERIVNVRRAIDAVIPDLWQITIANAKFRSPLLILDEAHHLKNPETRLASLFVVPEAEDDRNLLAGALDGAFERMLFLTATPFQLGHHELLNVIERFRGVSWRTLPDGYQEVFINKELVQLREALDTAQHRTSELDSRWQTLQPSDVANLDGTRYTLDEDIESWWNRVQSDLENMPERIKVIKRSYDVAFRAMKDAESVLKKWVIRHIRDRHLPGSDTLRRMRITGAKIIPGWLEDGGLPVSDDALLPFLLAARAQALPRHEQIKASRVTFADGLASSYEAFLDTRNGANIEEDSSALPVQSDHPNRYVTKMQAALPQQSAYASHPKIAPVIGQTLDLWAAGEKVVVFCHYRETGKALVRHISAAMYERIWGDAAKRYSLPVGELRKVVENFGNRFEKEGGMRRHLDADMNRRLTNFESLTHDEKEQIRDVIRRFVSSPVFVARYFDVNASSSESTLINAFEHKDSSGINLGGKIDAFLKFIALRCTETERTSYLDALNRLQPGIRFGTAQDEADDSLEQMGELVVMPNIRIANGKVRPETRLRLMLAFNTPFFPEILVASSVLAEGVDLHLNCRYIIHHDLSWNPSTLEQRTGRVDRIGAKAEQVMKPIYVYMPFIGGTQDEKQFRVVMDRERWFQVLMGDTYPTDEASTDAAAERLPFPLSAAVPLSFDLSVIPVDSFDVPTK